MVSCRDTGDKYIFSFPDTVTRFLYLCFCNNGCVNTLFTKTGFIVVKYFVLLTNDYRKNISRKFRKIMFFDQGLYYIVLTKNDGVVQKIIFFACVESRKSFFAPHTVNPAGFVPDRK